jgi:CRP/FNR family transcriptional regulator
MLDFTTRHESDESGTWNLDLPAHCSSSLLLRAFEPRRRVVRPKSHIFRAGQAADSVFLINSGVVKTALTTEDGREKIIGFRMRGDLLGLDAIGLDRHGCDAIALTTGEVWEYSRQQLAAAGKRCQQQLSALLAGEIRRDWDWMLATATLSAEQRVVTFLLDLSSRLQALGFSSRAMSLPMTRAEVGNYLALQLETVVRSLSKLQSQGLIAIEGRDIRLLDVDGLRAIIARPAHVPALRAA